MTICNNYVKSCHRALSAIIYIYMYFVWTIALNSHMHAHIYGSVHDYRYAPTSMTTFIHNLTKLKFAGTEKKWPNLRGRAVEVRALTQPICNLWAAKTNHSDKNDFFIKMLLERSCEYDQVVIDHPEVPRLDDQAPRHIYIYIYIRFFFSDTQHSFILFCLYARVYARLDNLRSLGGFSRWLQSSLLSTKRRKLHGVYLEIIFASPRNSMICSTWHSELTK